MRASPASGRSTAPRRQPSSMSRNAIARPMPLAAPVTIATGAVLDAMLRLRFAGGGGQIAARSPFRPGTVVERIRFLAECIEREPHGGGRHARAAGGDDRLVDVHAAGRERLLEAVGRPEVAVLDQL